MNIIICDCVINIYVLYLSTADNYQADDVGAVDMMETTTNIDLEHNYATSVIQELEVPLRKGEVDAL